MTLGRPESVVGLESPNDGAHELITNWSPPEEQTFFRRPAEILGDIRRSESRRLFAEYANGDVPGGMLAWARALAEDHQPTG